MLSRQFAVWVFDLDNTLYPASCGLFRQVQEKIQTTIAELLDIPLAEAGVLQSTYAREYGTSLRGLMNRHGVDPVPFLESAHDVDYGVLSPDPKLNEALAGLSGRKIIFTNGTKAHAKNVLQRLQIDPALFEDIYDLVDCAYVPKPEGANYDRLIDLFDIPADQAVMAEDSARNLRPALERGMAGILVDDGSDGPIGAHNRATDLSAYNDRLVVTPSLTDWLTMRRV